MATDGKGGVEQTPGAAAEPVFIPVDIEQEMRRSYRRPSAAKAGSCFATVVVVPPSTALGTSKGTTHKD